MDGGTPYADDDLRITHQTTPEEIRKFIERRAVEPIEIEGDGQRIQVWDFSNHEPHMEALEECAEGLRGEQYIIPFQVPAVWAYMQRVLPERIREADVLVYSKRSETYKRHPNYQDRAEEMFDRVARRSIERRLEER